MAPRTAKAKKTTEASEAPKKGRGKGKQVDTEPEIEDLDVDEKIAQPVEKKKRGKKAANDEGNGVEDDKDESAPLPKRGRKKVEEAPTEDDPETIEDNSGDDGSGHADDDASVDTNGDEPLKAASSRGRKKQPKKETAKAEPKGRGRKAKPDPEPEDEEEVVEDKPKGRGRGRKAAPKLEEDIDDPVELPKPKPGRGRKKAPTKITKEKTPDSDEVDEIEDIDEELIEEVKKKETKGRKGKKEVKEDSVEKEDEPEEGPAAKKRKGKKEEKGKGDYKDEEEEEDIPEAKPKGRGRAPKKAEVTTPEDDTDSTNKRRRKPIEEKAPEDKKKAPLKNKALTDYQNMEFSNDRKNAQGKEWNFKISSWNVGGIRSWLSKGGLDYVLHEKPDILCLQETKCAEDKLPEELTNLSGYHGYWCSGDKDGHAGVNIYTTQLAINVQKGLNNEELDEEGRIITAEYEQFYLICVYVPNSGRKLITLPKRLQWNEEFRKHVKELDKKKPVIICGDMNVSHKEIDLANPKTNKKNAGFTEEERAGMTDLLGDGFVDTFRHLYPDKTGAYTFWTYMMNCRAKNVGWRLDYFIVSERLLPSVCDNVIRDQVFGSDHCPISLFVHLPGADKPKESL